MKNKLELSEITIDAPKASKKECLAINDFFQTCNDFEEYLRSKFQLTSIEAYILAKTLIANYSFLIEDNLILLEIAQRNANYVKQSFKNPPEEVS